MRDAPQQFWEVRTGFEHPSADPELYDRDLAVTNCFCDPRSPWQKGAVENANGRPRRYLPSDAPADRLTADSLQALADRFNATPRRCLGYRTPAEVFNGRLDPTPDEAAASSAVSHQGWKVQ